MLVTSGLDLTVKVRFLSRPGSFPWPVDRVETIETHTSWLFLTEQRVYKLKKPLRYEYLDFSTPEDRRRNCEAEVRLNRRFNSRVYLGVVALTLDEGRLALEGQGPPERGPAVDWLVLMRRLPARQTLEAHLERGTVRREMVVSIARHLSRFYARAEPVALSAQDYTARHARELTKDRDILAEDSPGLERERVETIAGHLRAFLEQRGDLLESRVRQRRIVEGHGDLRPEHIYVGDDHQGEPAIIDCLEFNRDMRILDPVDELAFLAMQCRRLGGDWIQGPLFQVYREQCGDALDPRLVWFHQGCRAFLWARLAMQHPDREDDRDKWISRARSYLSLAEDAAGRAMAWNLSD